MGYPLGKAPVKVGEVPTPDTMPVFQGTAPTDMQRIIGARYMASGVLANGGGTVSGTSRMAYRVSPGAAFMWTDFEAKLGIEVPFDGVEVSTSPAPATGSRSDVIYVNSMGEVRVAQGATKAPNGVMLGRFIIPAGVTATQTVAPSVDRDYAILTGSTLGRLARWEDPGGGAAGTAEKTRFAGRFYLPSDRLVRIDLTSTLKAASSSGAMVFIVELQNAAGTWRRQLNANFGGSWGTVSATWTTGTREGANTITVKTKGLAGGSWQFTSTAPTEMSVWDAGVNR